MAVSGHDRPPVCGAWRTAGCQAPRQTRAEQTLRARESSVPSVRSARGVPGVEPSLVPRLDLGLGPIRASRGGSTGVVCG